MLDRWSDYTASSGNVSQFYPDYQVWLFQCFSNWMQNPKDNLQVLPRIPSALSDVFCISCRSWPEWFASLWWSPWWSASSSIFFSSFSDWSNYKTIPVGKLSPKDRLLSFLTPLTWVVWARQWTFFIAWKYFLKPATCMFTMFLTACSDVILRISN